ncbi:hypothetical protein KO525_07185 [Psychrosphaera sp. B3R10]|uniref:hypothetical protein n=1 Tax=unclassified Psychrosphaera TaxID=2641570 RepID=UPI001C088CCE|nr:MULTISPECIES: hypothetical protein [unclassified Psychrosphaera]MBU2883223.1 hypothetical protein [Psychrosphaera sp. I2R16]MBU2989158.1 hypothetical protein [Psychrosphaera sp. B3R10]
MRLISSYLFLAFILIANFPSSQGGSYGHQYQILETTINATLSCDIDSLGSEEFEDKFFLSKFDFELSAQCCTSPASIITFHNPPTQRDYLIRAPPLSLTS